MRCSACNREMMPLLISYTCDHCEGRRSDVRYQRGYVVYPEDADSRPTLYVFKSRQCAERWREANGYHQRRVRTVLTEAEIRWRPGRGTIRGLVLADKLFEIFPDHRHEPAANRAFLSPDQED